MSTKTGLRLWGTIKGEGKNPEVVTSWLRARAAGPSGFLLDSRTLEKRVSVSVRIGIPSRNRTFSKWTSEIPRSWIVAAKFPRASGSSNLVSWASVTYSAQP